MSEQDHSGMQPTTTTYMAETGPSGIKPAGLDLRGYELIDELGKGGMGAVYRCCDPALGRDLAIKVMRAEFQNYSEVERRFVREARVTGSLQHPGIVPIHNLGQLPDGRLHYTMRLVRGRTFADILKEEAGKPECLPSLLAIFEKVCEAAAYAHSKRVIHRDLKPANIMVGKFGEVQVMDWGLAKLLTAEGEPAEEEPRLEPGLSLIHTEAADTPSDLTRSGTSIGTPAYMAPEQALGDWELVDERADVFALGAILCAILTGEPPYSGSEDMDMLRRARRGELEDAWARLELCAADAALTTLCRECLSVDCSKRPRDAGVAALRVAAYQAEVEKRLRQAELERTEAEVKTREERKRRRVVVKLSAVVLFVFIVGALFSTRFALDARRQAEDAENQKTRADDNAKQAEQEKQLALQAREQAEQTLIEGLLRPIDPSGSRDSSLNAAEREAFTSLHSLQSDHIRMRFFEEGLRTAEKARRLDRRAAWVIQAAVGLNAGRRKQVKELLMHRLRDREAPLEVRAACVMLGIALDIQDAAFDESVRETVLSLVVNSIRWNTFEDLTERLKVASEHLDSDSSAKAVDLIANAISTSTDEDIPSFGMLLEALASMSGALNTASAEKVADLIVTAMSKTTDADVLSELSNGLASVSGRLEAAAAASHAAKAADRLVAAMSKTTDLNVLNGLANALVSVSGRLDAA
ncbi:MAG TPA: protein kinase, partial [Gemmataceae bacterium]|nr:protein kinase [Gemmataceae bacterium]